MVIANTPMYRTVGIFITAVIPKAKLVVIDVVNMVVNEELNARANRSSLDMMVPFVFFIFNCFNASVKMKISSAPIPKMMNMPATCNTPNNLIRNTTEYKHNATGKLSKT